MNDRERLEQKLQDMKLPEIQNPEFQKSLYEKLAAMAEASAESVAQKPARPALRRRVLIASAAAVMAAAACVLALILFPVPGAGNPALPGPAYFPIARAGDVSIMDASGVQASGTLALIQVPSSVKTGGDSSLVVRVSESAIVKFMPHTEASIAGPIDGSGKGTVILSLARGAVLVKETPSSPKAPGSPVISVQTPAGVIAPIGTMFMVAVDPASGTSVAVAEGAVTVTSADSATKAIRVNAGEERYFAAGGVSVGAHRIPGETLRLFETISRAGISEVPREMPRDPGRNDRPQITPGNTEPTRGIPVTAPRGKLHDYSGSQPAMSDPSLDATMNLPGSDIRDVYAYVNEDTLNLYIGTDAITPGPGVTLQYSVSLEIDSRTTLLISAAFSGAAGGGFTPAAGNCSVEITRGATRLFQAVNTGSSILNDSGVELAITVKTIREYISTDKKYDAVVMTRTVVDSRMNVIVDETASFPVYFPGPVTPGLKP